MDDLAPRPVDHRGFFSEVRAHRAKHLGKVGPFLHRWSARQRAIKASRPDTRNALAQDATRLPSATERVAIAKILACAVTASVGTVLVDGDARWLLAALGFAGIALVLMQLFRYTMWRGDRDGGAFLALAPHHGAVLVMDYVRWPYRGCTHDHAVELGNDLLSLAREHATVLLALTSVDAVAMHYKRSGFRELTVAEQHRYRFRHRRGLIFDPCTASQAEGPGQWP
ncbi:hypothetical protein [Nocardia salmonicida]|uniref:hypothetical protein n=1 Tax=Nocardia salmonicida TaxID=53431 RepID=UPI0012F49637|nr:hypothetical protein [Nocardia salmonicida]MBC7299531.1 hypothetical protein [Nocardia sp.]